MKKLIATTAMILAGLAQAESLPVQVVWPFAPGSTQATMVRNIIDSANKQQNKYQFVFISKPGAGGTIAANYVTNSNSLAVLASTSSFYIRSMMYYESHDPEQFSLVNTVCSHSPLVMFSRKYSSFKELKNHDITVGIIPGSITQLLTKLVAQNNPDIKFTEVPYKGTPEATTDMLAKHIDASVDLLSAGNLARIGADTSIIGITGTRSINGLPTMSSFKVKGLENLTNSYYLFLPKTAETAVVKEFNSIFNKAITETVRDSCNNEKGVVELLAVENAEQLHQTNLNQWKLITRGIAKQ